MTVSMTTGIASGINYDELVTNLIAVESRPITILQQRQADYQLEISSVLLLSTRLSSFKSAVDTLDDREQFNTKTASVTSTSDGVELLSASASSAAAVGSYDIEVNQLAAADKKASQGWVDQNTTAIASGSGTFRFKVGTAGAVTAISVTDTMTLQGLRDAINSAGAGVTASIINDSTGSNPYRLILSADDTGSSNTIDITQNDTDLDFSNKKVEAAYAYTTNTYSGAVASNEGNNYTGTTNKTFLVEIVAEGTPASGSAKYKYSIDGGITWLGSGGDAYTGSNGVTVAADDTLQNIDGLGDGATTTEGAKIKFTGGTLAVSDKFSIDVFNPEMQTAKDAVIEIDNATIVKSTNTITDAIQGVTLNLLKADTSEAVTLTVSSDTSSAESNIKSFVEAYNSVYEYINDQLVYDPDTEESADPLMGDPTVREIRRKLANIMTGTIPGLSSASYTNLSHIGITSDSKTGELSLDEEKLGDALSADPDAVAKLFVGTATPTNQAISFVSKASDTQAGTYAIYISTAPEKAILGGATDSEANDLSSTGLGEEEILTFMYSTDKTTSHPTHTTFAVTLAAGSTINSIVNSLNSAFATNEVGLSASNDSGRLKITSTGYGEDVWFQVSTSKSGDDQIWDTPGSRSDAGVDIEGTINSHVASGDGNVLTATSGFAEEGLKISSTSNQTGIFGTIAVSLGIADRMPSMLESYVDSDSGVLRSKESSIQDTVDYLDDRISTMAERLVRKEEQYRAQFARLEVLLARYSALSDYLTTQMADLSIMNTKA
jgi:flagellar hook-associated protein 2